jgi:hypothetical protein
LTRRQSDYSAVSSGEEPQTTHEFANVKSAKFQYYFYDQKNNEYVWLEEWVKKELPLAVRLEMEFNAEGSDKAKFVRTFNIPVANPREDEQKK